MITCKRIKEYLNNNYPYVETLAKLSNNSKITTKDLAFDFDKIKCVIYPECSSADALLIKKRLNLIEFKTGFDNPDKTLMDKTKKENLMLKIKEKADESLRILDIGIIGQIEKIDNEQLDNGVMKVYCAVIDVGSNAVVGEDVIIDIIAKAGDVSNPVSYKNIIDNNLKRLRKETDRHEKLFYNETFVMYDYEFDKNISKFK